MITNLTKSAITTGNISQSFTYNMAAKITGIDMERLLCHCHSMYKVTRHNLNAWLYYLAIYH